MHMTDSTSTTVHVGRFGHGEVLSRPATPSVPIQRRKLALRRDSNWHWASLLPTQSKAPRDLFFDELLWLPSHIRGRQKTAFTRSSRAD